MTIRGPWAVALLVCLVLSLAGNLFTAGVMAGRGFTRPPPPPPGQAERNLGALMSGLPTEARSVVREQINAVRPAVARELGALRQARQAMMEQLRQPSIDDQALGLAMEEVRNRTAEAQRLVQDAVVRAAGDLSADQRERWRPRVGGDDPR